MGQEQFQAKAGNISNVSSAQSILPRAGNIWDYEAKIEESEKAGSDGTY